MALYDPMIPADKKKKEQPYTFIGPSADKAIASGARTALNQTPPESFGAEAGQASGGILNRTAKGYPNVGLSTPPSPAREPVLNVPFDNGQPAPSVGSTARSLLNKSDLSPAVNPVAPKTQQLGSPSEQFRSRLKGGIEYTADDQGNRTFTMGTPGQDGFGKVTTRAGSARAQLGAPAQAQSPYSFEGSAADAAKFNAPAASTMMRRALGTPQAQDQGMSPLDMSHQAWLEHSGQGAKSGPQMPKYLTKEEGAALGLGWQERMVKYREDMDAFNKATGNQNALDIESMREAGAGSRALLHAKWVNDQNAIAARRLGIDQQRADAESVLGAVDVEGKRLGIAGAKRLDDLQNRYMNEADSEKRNALGKQLLTLTGKDTGKYQIVTREEALDPTQPMLGTQKIPYAINPDNPRESFALGSGAGGDVKGYASALEGMNEKDQLNFLSALKKSNPKVYERLKAHFSQENK